MSIDQDLARARTQRPRLLGELETLLRARNPDLDLFVSALAHYGEPGLAQLHLHGVDSDRERRSRLLKYATAWLLERGISIELQEGRDLYDIRPWREARWGRTQDMGSLDELDEI
ncbi:hypothetical protein [Thioclava nitratireducens]|uniref:hypothetical protein n=1 Tax=Thioclava nitratireducens TaxID=1915078 RepID=UPI0024807E99|nr:hypothetical protein [Thioclava nitratireducens]WGT51370.1 hypothetical protein P0N61_04875 [Thioclava nitratireducens]